MVRRRAPIVVTAVVLIVVLAALATGCGGGGSSGVASVASSTAAATTSATTTTQNGTLASAFAFARCMRSHGIAGWPDPDRQGFFDKAKLRPLLLNVSRVRALEDGPCNMPLPSHQGYTITPADRADYLRGAACMRAHGFAGFPDPTFPSDNVRFDIPSSINQDAPRFRSAARICTRLIPAGLPYSHPNAH